MAKKQRRYGELLKDPRWQKKRLQVLERDNWTCQGCDKKSDTLNVHHYMYVKGGNPWDSEDADLVTLCEACHSTETLRANSIDAIACLLRRIPAIHIFRIYDILSMILFSKGLRPCKWDSVWAIFYERGYELFGWAADRKMAVARKEISDAT